MRPGVYSSYTIVGGYAGASGGAVGVIAASPTGEAMIARHFTRLNEAFAEYGSDAGASMMTALVKLLFLGRVCNVYCVSVGEEPAQGDYEAAYDLLDAIPEVTALVCDADDLPIVQALGARLVESAEHARERMGYFGAPQDGEPDAAARAINCERVCLTLPAVTFEGGERQSAAYLAAACCAAVATESDPAANLNLTAVAGEFGFPAAYSEPEITVLLSAGVTVLESAGGAAEMIRALTTKTSENGAVDYTMRELSTVRIIDDVVPSLRGMLKSRLHGAKNNAATRDAIRTQVACELEKKCTAGVIEHFEPPVVYPKADEPTVCMVEVGFSVIYGMHRIELVAHITV